MFAPIRRFIVLVALLGLTTPIFATTMIRLSFTELFHDANIVVRAKCTRTSTHFDHGEIWTDSVFHVVSHHKGVMPGDFVVRELGGSYGDLESRVEGVPEFHPGEDVFLFLVGSPGKPFQIVGWTQGVFHVRPHVRSSELVVTQECLERASYDPERGEFMTTGVRELPLPVFVQRLERELYRAE